MLFALLALVAMMLGAMALVRSVDSGSLALGNLGFKKDATMVAQLGTDRAISYLSGQVGAGVEGNDDVKNGYYSTTLEPLDYNGQHSTADNLQAVVDWSINKCSGVVNGNCVQPTAPITDAYGNQVSWIITRLCSTSGSIDAPNVCLKPAVLSGGVSYDMGKRDYTDPEKFKTSAAGPFYRVITRVVGTRGSVSFTETLVHF
jgi:hypothetical protein